MHIGNRRLTDPLWSLEGLAEEGGEVPLDSQPAYFIIPDGTALAMGDLADGTFLQKSGSSIVGTTSLFGDTVVRLTEDVSTLGTTFVDATGLSFSVLASTDYVFRFVISYSTHAATTGIAFAVNGPASPGSIVLGTWIPTSSSFLDGTARAYDSGSPSTGVDVAGMRNTALVEGLFRNGGNAGTLALRFASEVSGSLVTVRSGSLLFYRTV